MLKMLALKTLYGGQFKLSTQLIMLYYPTSILVGTGANPVEVDFSFRLLLRISNNYSPPMWIISLLIDHASVTRLLSNHLLQLNADFRFETCC